MGLRTLDLTADLPLLERWLRSPQALRWWGPADQHIAALAQRSADTHAVITTGGRPVGYLCWQRPSPAELAAAGLTDLPEDLVDIDILIGEPAYLGQGIGPSALAALLPKLRAEGVAFAGLGTATANRVAIRAFEKAGFRRVRDFAEPEFGPCTYLIVSLRARPPSGGGA